MKGQPITTIEEVCELARKGKAVYVSVWKRHSPAAFLACWQANVLYGFVKNGRLFHYMPNKQPEPILKESL